jgi:hypothetical protein
MQSKSVRRLGARTRAVTRSRAGQSQEPSRAPRRAAAAGGQAWDIAGWLREHGDDAAALALGVASLVTILGMLG